MQHNILSHGVSNMSVTSMAAQLSVRLDDELEARLDEYREQFDFEPTQSEVVRKALQRYLDEEGV